MTRAQRRYDAAFWPLVALLLVTSSAGCFGSGGDGGGPHDGGGSADGGAGAGTGADAGPGGGTVACGPGTATCPADSYCDLGSNVCKPGCDNDSQCTGTTKTACDLVSHACVCGTGFHSCGNQCASDTSVDSCATSCTPCPVPANGTAATCDGTSCGFTCNAGYHACGSSCGANTSPDTCGSSCTPCQPPDNATATCDGTSCGYTCKPGFSACATDGSRCCPLITKVVAGAAHACALDVAGGVFCWGDDSRAQLGIGPPSANPSSTPQPVKGLSGVADLSGNGSYTCALTTSGAVLCWGANGYGQLGNGTLGDSGTPVQVTGLGSGVIAISAGSTHACAVLASGGLKCWGRNADGELGDGTTNDSATPVDVAGLWWTKTTGVAAGGSHTCAWSSSYDRVDCWGDGTHGELGDGKTQSTTFPVDALFQGGATISGVTALAAAGGHTCAISQGNAFCWGGNINGALGIGDTADRTEAIWSYWVTGTSSNLLAVGSDHICTKGGTDEWDCCGSNTHGQIGDGNSTQQLKFDTVTGLPAGVTQMSAGYAFTCAVTAAQGVMCWGDNSYGQLGNPDYWDAYSPTDVVF